MRIRSIDFPADIQWQAPVMQAQDVGAAVQASQLLQLAGERAEQIVMHAQASAESIESQTRESFLASYGEQYHAALNDFLNSRRQVENNLSHYATQVVQTALERLGLVLSDTEKFRAVLAQVLSETLPDTSVCLRVASGFEEQVRESLQAGGYQMSCFSIQADPSLAADEVIVVGPQGSRISCSFTQLVNQLLLCV